MGLNFAALPFEIRQTIYQHALTPTRTNDIRTTDCLSLLATSKQIYDEACLLPFQSSVASLPAITDSSTSATLRLLQRLSPKQLNAIRKLSLQVVGSTLDIAAAAKVLRTLRLGNDQGDEMTEVDGKCLPANGGDLRELDLIVSSRDIAVPLADCRIGLQQALDVATSPLFSWIAEFDKLRKLHVRVRVLRDAQFPKVMREELHTALAAKLRPQVICQIDYDAVQTPDCFLDELDLYPDSYVGILGNIWAVPMEFQHVYNGVEWAYG